MRAFHLGIILLAVATPGASAQHCDDGGPGCDCPSYEDRVSVDDDTWVDLSTDDTWVDLSTDDTWMLLAAEGHYASVDGVPVLFSPGTFNIWYDQESNGRPGFQRADEVCDNTPEGEDSDAISC